MVNCVITANGNAQRHSRFCGLCRPVQPDVPRHTVKVLNPLEKDPLCTFWECNPGLIPKLNEYKIVHFLIYD